MAGGVNPLGNLLGKVNANGALVVTLDGGAIAGSLATITSTGLVTTSTDGVIVTNTTASTVGVPVQISPRTRWSGTAWDSDDAVSRTVSSFIEVLGVSGATVSSITRFGVIDPVASTITYPVSWTSAGKLTITGGFQMTVGQRIANNVQDTFEVTTVGFEGVGSGGAGLDRSEGFYFAGTRSRLKSSANALVNVLSNDSAFGVQINTGTAAPTANNGTITTGSRNACGEVTLTGGNTGATITFGAPAFTNTPFVVITEGQGTNTAIVSATSTTAFTFTGATANGIVRWVVLGRI
jgi:hypothetical protein